MANFLYLMEPQKIPHFILAIKTWKDNSAKEESQSIAKVKRLQMQENISGQTWKLIKFRLRNLCKLYCLKNKKANSRKTINLPTCYDITINMLFKPN